MNLLHIAWWDMKRVAKDRLALLWLLALPLAFAFIFGSAFHGGHAPATWIPVVDLDRGELSRLFIAQLQTPGNRIEVKGPESLPDLKQKWPYGVVIPAGFTRQILRGEAVKLTVVKGGANPDRILEVQACVTRAILRLTKSLAAVDASRRPWDAAAQQALAADLARAPLLTVARQSARSLRPPPAGFQQSLPGMLVMFVLQMILIYGGTSLVQDRVQGQFVRLRAAPVRAGEIFLGKVLGRLGLACLQAAVLLGGGAWLFDLPLGDQPAYLVPVVLSFAFFAACFSLLGGLAFRTEKQVVQMAIFSAIVLAALGGSWWPVEIVPPAFQTIAAFTPTYWGIHGLQSVMYFNHGSQVLRHECLVLLGFAGLCLLAAIPLARRLARGGGAA